MKRLRQPVLILTLQIPNLSDLVSSTTSSNLDTSLFVMLHVKKYKLFNLYSTLAELKRYMFNI
jgi:hypothetical protein